MTYRRILVPVDGGRTSNIGLREAIRLAKGQHASLQLVHVVDEHYVLSGGMDVGARIDDILPALMQGGRQVLRKGEALVKRQGLSCSTVLLETPTGPAASAIVRQAKKWRADLIVIGTHGRRGVRRLLMGSDAEEIVRSSPVPVMLVRK
jgi:nucleotide-binding universal stress UspA family protein